MSKVSQTASKNKRFVLENQGRIFDKLHPESGTEHVVYMNAFNDKPYDDELHLRTGMLVRRFETLVPELCRGNGRKRDRKTLSYKICGLLPDSISTEQTTRANFAAASTQGQTQAQEN